MTPIIFQALSWHAEDVDVGGDAPEYMIKVFGMDANGKTVSATITNFKPFFYVKAPRAWSQEKAKSKVNTIADSIGCSVTYCPKHDFWGFTNEELFSFYKIECDSFKQLRSFANIFSRKKIEGYKLPVYESNIDPYIRFMHLHNLEPSGWIQLQGYSHDVDYIQAISDIDVQVRCHNVTRYETSDIAPFLVASFDIECTSSGGDFPVPKKDYRHIASQMYDINKNMDDKGFTDYNKKNGLVTCLKASLNLGPQHDQYHMSCVDTKVKINQEVVENSIEVFIDDIYTILVQKGAKEQIISKLNLFFKSKFPKISGDKIIQIGTTFHTYGSKDTTARHIVTLGTCDPIEGATVVSCESESELLLAWTKLINTSNPDIVTGYNIFGFDFDYMFQRAQELGIEQEFMKLSRIAHKRCDFKEQRLSSSALGDNFLKFIDMEGRVLVDLMKVVQRDHKLESYKLDNVAAHFLGQNKHDVSPQEIFKLQKGTSKDRQTVAAYCLQDCALCNYLVMKLEIVANNMGMSNVCLVPMSFIFMRGQGIKIFSLVLNQCNAENYVIPVIKKDISIRKEDLEFLAKDINININKLEDEVKNIIKMCKNVKSLDDFWPSVVAAGIVQKAVTNLGGSISIDTFKKKWSWVKSEDMAKMNRVLKDISETESNAPDEDSYEGAIVLDPKEGIYTNDPVSVLDFASLYPSSMISEDLSHNRIVLNPEYDNIPGIDYLDIYYDIYDDKKQKVGERKCRYAQPPKKGIIPRILMKLLAARKATRKKMTWKNYKGHIGVYDKDNNTITTSTGDVVDVNVDEMTDAFNEFQVAVLDGLQNAYKVTANSLYGQIGAKTSQIYLRDIAACTTATGRKMITMACDFLEKNYNANVIYGDTDSVFVIFPTKECIHTPHEKIMPSIQLGIEASNEFKKLIKKPHDLEYEKTFWPFILLSKKRYVGNLYEMDDKKYKQKSMGIVLKRRDNAQIVKTIYGGIIDIILGEQNIQKSIDFLQTSLSKLIEGKYPIENLVVTKALKAEYKDPTRIAHKVLADRIAEREPGNKPQIGDRIPYMYVVVPNSKVKILQGERIETPSFARENDLKPDYNFYITNQIMKPILQIYALIVEQLPGFPHPPSYYQIIKKRMQQEINDPEKEKEKMGTVREMDVKAILFDPILAQIENCKIRKSLIAKKYFKE